MPHLFSPIKIKNKEIKNRIVMPLWYASATQEIMDLYQKNIRHYEARAKGGAGLIIVEATCIARDGRLASDQLGIWSDEHIEGLKRLSQACQFHGAAVLIQIHHAGLRHRGCCRNGSGSIPLLRIY